MLSCPTECITVIIDPYRYIPHTGTQWCSLRCPDTGSNCLTGGSCLSITVLHLDTCIAPIIYWKRNNWYLRFNPAGFPNLFSLITFIRTSDYECAWSEHPRCMNSIISTSAIWFELNYVQQSDHISGNLICLISDQLLYVVHINTPTSLINNYTRLSAPSDKWIFSTSV